MKLDQVADVATNNQTGKFSKIKELKSVKSKKQIGKGEERDKKIEPTLPSTKSCVPILTTVHPIAFAELRPRVWFSFLSHGLRTRFVLIARSSMVPGTATLISLLRQ